MINFDFYNLLFPTEFEKFCRDVVDIRDSPIKFTTYKRGKDGGIDFKSTNTERKIIGQCKLYNPKNLNSFFSNLKNEIRKCKRQKPDRYIICTNLHLDPEQAEKILNLFEGYILSEEDIIDGEKLNKYLGQDRYQHLLRTYSKLLVPNLQFVELALERIINKKYYNKTASFLRGICKEHKLFHNTQILKHCINILEKNRVIILTGNPGVGKTTTAKMIANYFLSQKVKNILFLSDYDFKEIEGIQQDNQIIVIDDFWGQNFSPSLNDGSLLRNFNRIVNDFKESSSCYLILTSREYIIKDVLNYAEFETKKILDVDKFVVNLNDYSKEDKVRIFLNHLLFYDFEKSYFKYLRYSDTLENIIGHRNYSPRHIEYFIRQYLSNDTQDSYHFYHSFLKYLDKPNEYWNNNFSKINGTSKLILLTLLISSDPIDLKDLEMSFDSIQTAARISLNEEIKPLTFNHELKLLEDFYLISDKHHSSNQVLIRFQNPGIKDFLLEYLRTDGKAWIKPLLENAQFFNQLNFIFSTEDEKVDDYDSDTCLFGNKIVLSDSLQKVLKNRLLSKFHFLNFCTQEEREFTGEFSTNHTSEETKYWKLILLNNLFKVSKDQNQDIRSFIIGEVRKDIDNYSGDAKIVNFHSMQQLPTVLEIIKPYTQLEASRLITYYYNSITFTKEFDSFYEFKRIFPVEFSEFLDKNIIAVRKAIKSQIIDDIDYYRWYEMDIEFDTHLDYMIEEVCKKYQIRLTSKMVDEIEGMADRSFLNPYKYRKRKKKKPKGAAQKYKSTYKPKKFDAILDEYLPEHTFQEFNPIKYLKSIDIEGSLAKALKKAITNEGSFLKPFFNNEEVFSYVVKMIQTKGPHVLDYGQYMIVDSFFTFYCINKDLDVSFFKNIFIELASDSFGYDFSITKTQFRKLLKEYQSPEIDIAILSPIIVSNKNWYNFSSHEFKIYFVVEYLNSIKSNEEFKDQVIDYSLCTCDVDLLNLLSHVCRQRLLDLVVIPELERFLCSIDPSSPESTLLSFLKFFDIEFDLYWNKQKKRLEENSSSNQESFIETIIQYMRIDFSVTNIDTFFLKENYTNEIVQEYFINTRAYGSLYTLTIGVAPKTGKRNHLKKEDASYITINLYNFANNVENYRVLREIGMEKYIITLYESIKLRMKQIRC
jgi:DNA polymerase III delta prime subunit